MDSGNTLASTLLPYNGTGVILLAKKMAYVVVSSLSIIMRNMRVISI